MKRDYPPSVSYDGNSYEWAYSSLPVRDGNDRLWFLLVIGVVAALFVLVAALVSFTDHRAKQTVLQYVGNHDCKLVQKKSPSVELNELTGGLWEHKGWSTWQCVNPDATFTVED